MVSEVSALVPSKTIGIVMLVCNAAIAVVKVVGVKSLPELTIEKLTLAAVALLILTVSVVFCAMAVFVKELNESDAPLNAGPFVVTGVVGVIAATSLVFLQPNCSAKSKQQIGIISFFKGKVLRLLY